MNTRGRRDEHRLRGALWIALLASSCGGREAPSHRSEGTPRRVDVVAVSEQGSSEGLVLPGRVRARDEVTLSSTVRARLTSLPFAEGASFRAGEVVARFGTPESKLELDAARASARAAAVRLEEAHRQEARMESLWVARVVATRDREVAQTEARLAEAAHQEARARAALLESGLLLRAPFDGVVVRHAVDVGATLGPGSPVVVIRSGRGHEIEIPIPESRLERLLGARFAIRTGGSGWRPARLARLEGMTDFVSRTRIAYLVPADHEALDPGAYAEVRILWTPTPAIDDGPPAALRVPSSCVVRRGALTGVYVAREGRARLRWVRLGRVDADSVEVLAGLWAADRVVRDPAQVSDGLAIEPRE